MKKIISSLLVLFIIGCSSNSKVSICPKYPSPSKRALKIMIELDDYEINRWLEKQIKLNKKLKACNE